MTDCAGSRDFSACRARSSPTGVSQESPASFEEAAAVDREGKAHEDPQWLQENSVVFNKGPVKVAQPLFAGLARGLGEPPGEMGKLFGRGAPGEDREERCFDGHAVVAGEIGDLAGGGEHPVLDLIADDLAVHEQQALGDGAAAGVEFILAAVAVAADEIVAAGVCREPDEPVRLRADRRDRGGLEERTGDLLGPQPASSERRPRRLPALRRSHAVVDAVEPERPARGDDANEPVHVVIVRGKVGGKQVERGMQLTGGRQVVDRLGERAAQEQGPDAIHRGTRKIGVPRVGDPGCKLLARTAGIGLQLGAEGHAGGDVDRLFGLPVRRPVFVLFAVADAPQARVGAAEERSEAAEIILLPVLERMVVALGAVDPHAQKRAGHPRRQAFGGRHFEIGVIGHGHEVGRRLVGPEALVGDHLLDQAVVMLDFRAMRR